MNHDEYMRRISAIYETVYRNVGDAKVLAEAELDLAKAKSMFLGRQYNFRWDKLILDVLVVYATLAAAAMGLLYWWLTWTGWTAPFPC